MCNIRRFVLLSGAMLFAAAAYAQTQNCIQNEWNISQGNSSTCTSASCTLGCTANDVSIAQVVNVRDLSGSTIVNCQAGQKFTFIADFEIKTTSKSSRSNIGMYIAKTGTTVADALSVNNSCADNIIPPPLNFTNTNTDGKHPTIGNTNGHFTCAGTSNIQCGTDYFDELDQATTKPADNCGDTSSADLGWFGVGTQKVTLEIPDFTCPNPATSTLPTCTINNVTGPCAVLPNCTSWQVPGQTTLCVASNTGTQSYPLTSNGIPEAVPGTSSKCNCEVITLPVIVQKPSVTVTKSCVTADTPAPSTGYNTSCSSGKEGADEVTYTVTVTNTSNFGSTALTQVTDSVYGTLLGTGAFTGNVNSGCSATTINAGSSATCTFTAHKYGDPLVATVTDTATASGTSQNAGSFGPTNSNSVTVTPVEAPSAATVTTGLGSPNLTDGCATANFTVDVKNTSDLAGCPTGGCDVTESLTGLSDSTFGDITSVQGSVLGTTCGVTTGAGTLPAPLAPNARYQCVFNAKFCGQIQPVDELGTGQCSISGTCTNGQLKPLLGTCAKDSDCNLQCQGLTHQSTVTAIITGDESADVVAVTGNNTLTVNVCLTPFTQASH